MPIKDPISLSELAKEVKINKSKLHYYVSLGLLNPTKRIGGAIVLEKNIAIRKLKLIKDQQSRGKTLKEIGETIK